jgi:copper chaperone CopZ
VIALDIKGMRCPDCAQKLSMSLLFLSGSDARRVVVDFDAGKARVTIDPPNSISPEMLIESIERCGFSATHKSS